MKKILLGLLLLYCTSSCNDHVVYEQLTTIPNDTWTYENAITFNVPITDTNQLYNIYLNIDHTTDYYYQNLYTFIQTTYPSGRTVGNPLTFDLADKLGKWHGNCQKEQCHYTIQLQRAVNFKELGDHKITVQQYMRKDSLEAIGAIGFLLEAVVE